MPEATCDPFPLATASSLSVAQWVTQLPNPISDPVFFGTNSWYQVPQAGFWGMQTTRQKSVSGKFMETCSQGQPRGNVKEAGRGSGRSWAVRAQKASVNPKGAGTDQSCCEMELEAGPLYLLPDLPPNVGTLRRGSMSLGQTARGCEAISREGPSRATGHQPFQQLGE